MSDTANGFDAGGRSRTSATSRLLELDPVFSLADLQARFKLSAAVAKNYPLRWIRAGLVERFGGGVYFNLVADRDGPRNRLAEALDKLLRLPVLVVGGAAVQMGGWTTQIHRRVEIAVPVVRGSISIPALEGDVVLTPRYARWFNVLRDSAVEVVGPVHGVACVPPAMALADALLSRDLSVARHRPVTAVPPEELDMDAFGAGDLEEVRRCLTALGATADDAEALLSPYRSAVVADDGPQDLSW